MKSRQLNSPFPFSSFPSYASVLKLDAKIQSLRKPSEVYLHYRTPKPVSKPAVRRL